jgi:hypothetical protein
VQLSPRYDVEPTKHSPRNDRLPAVKADFKFVDRSNRTIDMVAVSDQPARAGLQAPSTAGSGGIGAKAKLPTPRGGPGILSSFRLKTRDCTILLAHSS